MGAGVVIPLGVFLMVVLIVAITSVAKMRDREIEVHQRLYLEEREHQLKMQELEAQLQQLRQAGR